jgi:hypothetical protein
MMDYIKKLETWAKGDALQGRIMIGIGLIVLVSLVILLRNNDPFYNGMLIPVGLLLIICWGYGGFLAFSRPRHFKTTAKHFETKRTEILNQELTKALTDNKNYSMLKPIWVLLIIISIVLFFIITKEYYKGLCIGLLILFIGGLFLDAFLHRRLKPYLSTLQNITH